MVFKVNKNSDYTIMSNYHFREKNMSLKAKGLLSLMLSLPSDWDYSISGLATLSSDGETSVRSGLKELEEFGYLTRTQIRENGVIIDWEYNVFEIPQDIEEPLVEAPVVENQVVANQRQYNTNKQNTKNNKVVSKDTTSQSGFEFGKPKVEKKSLYQKCSDMIIDRYSSMPRIKDLLFKYLDLRLEIAKDESKPLYSNMWKGILDTLDKVHQQGYALEDIIEQSITKGYKSFYPVNGGNSTISFGNPDTNKAPQKKGDKSILLDPTRKKF